MAFEIYDFGGDKKLDAVDLFALCKHNGDLDSEELFRDAYAKDVCRIADAIDKKRRSLGMQDMEIGLKLDAIERKLQKYGGSLQSEFVNKFAVDLQQMSSFEVNKDIEELDSDDELNKTLDNGVGNVGFARSVSFRTTRSRATSVKSGSHASAGKNSQGKSPKGS